MIDAVRGVVGRSTARTRQLVRLGATLRRYLATPIDLELAQRRVARRMDEREANFLAMVGRLVHPFPASPYSRLLRWADCAPADLEASSRAMACHKTQYSDEIVQRVSQGMKEIFKGEQAFAPAFATVASNDLFR